MGFRLKRPRVVAQAAFYAGWPNAFTAAPVVGEVLRARESKAE